MGYTCVGMGRSLPSPELAHARTVLLVMLVHAPMRLSLLWHSVMDASVPSQSTAARATGRFSNRTCTTSTLTTQNSSSTVHG